jgi:hypothetical protein
MKYLLLLLIPLSSHAQNFTFNKDTGKAVPNFVAELKLLKGNVLLTTGGRPRPVKQGDKFYPKDVIATEANSTMKILVTDDTWISLGPESELAFTEFEFKDKTDRKITYELRKGQLAANVRQKVKSGAINFRTRYSTMGVRGTKLLVNYREMSGVGISEFALIEGKAEVQSDAGTSHDLASGERIVLINGKNKESSLEKLELSREELEKFSSPEGEEKNDIRPFMPYYEPKALTVTKASVETLSQKSGEKETTGPGTFDNLKKLNEQLKDNQKKRR